MGANGWNCGPRRALLIFSGRRLAARVSLAPAAEYADACGVPTSGHLPMALFAPTAPTNTHLHIPTVETRAVTPGPAVKGMLQPTVPFVFERSAANSLGISMPTVPMGQVQIPKITTAPPADTLAKDGAAPSTAAAVTLVNQSPVRIAGQLEVRIEDLAVMPSLESALSESLQGSMSNELDEQVFNGAAGDLNGLFTQAANVNAAGAAETFATGIARFTGLVDGRHAYDLSDVRAVIGTTAMSSEQHRIDGTLECREATDSPGRLVGTILPVGRVAGDRPELFVGSGVTTPSAGIALLPEHRS